MRKRARSGVSAASASLLSRALGARSPPAPHAISQSLHTSLSLTHLLNPQPSLPCTNMHSMPICIYY